MAWTLEIHHIDVAQGDSTLVVAREVAPLIGAQPIVRSCLIDGGRGNQANTVHAYVANILGNNPLSAIVATHLDGDHVNGIINLLTKRGVGPQARRLHPLYADTYVYDQGWPRVFDENASINYVRAINGRRTDSRANGVGLNRFRVTDVVASDPYMIARIDKVLKLASFRIGAPAIPQLDIISQPHYLIDLEILWNGFNGGRPAGAPTITCVAANLYTAVNGGGHTGPFGGNGVDPKNEKSLGFLVQYTNFKYYIGGDLTSTQEDGNAPNGLHGRLNPTNNNAGRVHAMKCSHHGSQHSSSQAFINHLRSRAAFISCGIGNGFGQNGPIALANNYVFQVRQLDLYSVTVNLTNNHELTLNIIAPNNLFLQGFQVPSNPPGQNICAAVAITQQANIRLANQGTHYDFGLPNGGTLTLTNGGTISGVNVANNTVINLAVGAAFTFDNGNQITITISNGSNIAGNVINNNTQVAINNGATLVFTNDYGTLEILDAQNAITPVPITLTQGGQGQLPNGHPNQRVIDDLQNSNSLQNYFTTNDRAEQDRNARLFYNNGNNYPQAYTAKAVIAGSGISNQAPAGNIRITVTANQANGNTINNGADAQFTVQYHDGNNQAQNVNYP